LGVSVVHLCLGNLEVVEYLKQTSRIIAEFHLDWLKWDNSAFPASRRCAASVSRPQRKMALPQRGAYAVWEHLQEESS
jgi:hypothetical protein